MVNVNNFRRPSVYGLHSGDGVVRYVGSTTKNSKNRLYEHVYRANSGHTGPVYQWMRAEGVRSIEVVDLELVDDIACLPAVEARWIVDLLARGNDLTNQTSRDGRVGSMSAASRARVGDANRGKPTWSKGRTGEEAGWTRDRRDRQSALTRARYAKPDSQTT